MSGDVEYWRQRALLAEGLLREYNPDMPCRGCGHGRHHHNDPDDPDTIPCTARDPDDMDEDRDVACLCYGWWEPETPCPYTDL